MSSELDTLVKQLGNLNVVEAGELAKKLEKAWGLNLDSLMSQPAQAQAPVEEVKDTATVILKGFDANKKIAVLKKVREYMDLGLLEAKNFVEGCIEKPSSVLDEVDKDKAEACKTALVEAGGVVELK
ncbi:MAG: 50S ribosomal protein L7/L12 [Euryarchaeota archaeon]|nr:50S ribosomal protein L7/L12 [Euryarchaeota archaeon]|tara:strand:+ start:1854 stop:2234 length:381 start_codon:yes stop_codon:yes gene_type:complete